MDITPFQNDLVKTAPRVSDNTKVNRYTAQSPLLPEEPFGFFTNHSEMLLSSAQDFFDVTLAYEESASEFFDVTLAREDDRLGVLPDPDRRCKFSLIVSY